MPLRRGASNRLSSHHGTTANPRPPATQRVPALTQPSSRPRSPLHHSRNPSRRRQALLHSKIRRPPLRPSPVGSGVAQPPAFGISALGTASSPNTFRRLRKPRPDAPTITQMQPVHATVNLNPPYAPFTAVAPYLWDTVPTPHAVGPSTILVLSNTSRALRRRTATATSCSTSPRPPQRRLGPAVPTDDRPVCFGLPVQFTGHYAANILGGVLLLTGGVVGRFESGGV